MDSKKNDDCEPQCQAAQALANSTLVKDGYVHVIPSTCQPGVQVRRPRTPAHALAAPTCAHLGPLFTCCRRCRPLLARVSAAGQLPGASAAAPHLLALAQACGGGRWPASG